MEIGVSSACLYPEYLETSLDRLEEAGFTSFEIFFNAYSELRPEYLASIKKDRKIVSIHPFSSGFETFLLFSEHYRRFQDTVEGYKTYFSAAASLGAKVFVLHGQRDYDHSKISEEEYFERFAVLSKGAAEFGVTLAQENVNRFRSEDPAFISRMRRYLADECAFVLDIKQAVRAGHSPFTMLEAMGNRIVHVHLSDHTREEHCLPPGKGSFDFSRLSRELRRIGFAGTPVIELYRRNFRKISELSEAKDRLAPIFR